MPRRSVSATISAACSAGVGPARVRLLDDAAEVALEHADGRGHQPPHLGIDGRVAPVRAVGDAQSAQLALGAAPPVEVGRRQAVAIAPVRSRRDREHERAVGHRPAQRTDVLERFPPGDAGIALVARAGIERDAPHRGLEAVDSAVRRRDPHRDAAVAADGDGTHAGRHRHAGARARAARRERRVPGIARRLEQRVVTGGAVAELRGVRLADDDRAGVAQPLDHHVVLVRTQSWYATEADVAAGPRQDEVLDADGHAGQRADLLPGDQASLLRARLARAAPGAGVQKACSAGSTRSMRRARHRSLRPATGAGREVRGQRHRVHATDLAKVVIRHLVDRIVSAAGGRWRPVSPATARSAST